MNTNYTKDILETELSIGLAAAPRDGEANEELLEYIKNVLNVKKHQISLLSGGKNRNKIVGLENGVLSSDQVV